MKSHLWTNHSFWMRGSAFFCSVFLIRFSYYINLSFYLKNAPVEVEVILLTPVDAWCITFQEAEEDAAFIGSSGRFCVRRHHEHPDKKVLNPLLGANRMTNIVSQLFELYEVNMPIKKVILSRNGYVDYPEALMIVRYWINGPSRNGLKECGQYRLLLRRHSS
ncbi:hypothetical protein M3699_06865 [Peribacillus simplex]|uniref:hypothetical protein n=1 Tax=Peribacillus simplex TaxID=1478 RepID=UPI00203D6190|nr:hypothetical protein [Peribacillus simplex]MCM3673609.1 hypothetical protein [Peribacillus simplex]